MAKVDKGKTRYDVEGLLLAKYVADNFPLLKEEPVYLNPKATIHKISQKYLDLNVGRMEENQLEGIVCIVDRFRNHTGGRVDIVLILNGPVVEAIQPAVIGGKIRYQARSRYFLRAIKAVSGVTAPYVGNIHLHLFEKTEQKLKFTDVFKSLQEEHEFQNDLRHKAHFNLYLYTNQGWRGKITADMVGR